MSQITVQSELPGYKVADQYNLNKAYTWAIQTCNAPDVGYSKTYRYQQTVNGITYYDCSSFIWYALKAGGWPLTGSAFTTRTMRTIIQNYGWYQVPSTGTYLPGDIGWKTGHTEMCYKGGTGKGIFMGAHTANATLANQVSIGSSGGNAEYERSFTEIYRYGTGGATDPGAGEYGYSLYVIAAICGNWWSESNINPGLYEGRKVVDLTDNSVYGGYGLGQWTNTTNVHRRTNLANWLRSNGYNDDSPEGQLAYFIYENYWNAKDAYPEFKSLTSFLTSTSTDLALLTNAFCSCWEGIPISQERVDRAQTVYNYLLIHAQDYNIDEWYISNNYLTQEQILNNAVMVFRLLTAGGGGGGSFTRAKRGLPVWMMVKYPEYYPI